MTAYSVAKPLHPFPILPPAVSHVINHVKRIFPEEYQHRLLLVGGCVRDLLLEHPIRDIDLISDMTPDELSSCNFRMVTGRSTAPVWLRHDESCGSLECTLIPTLLDLQRDLAQRDLTINAMAMTLDGKIIDPFDGRADLAQTRLRACSPRSFLDDPLRIFRAVRFEADNWTMTDDTEQLIQKQDWIGALENIPVERFSREMIKALELKRPELFFQRMLELSVGDHYLPELFRMPNIPAGPLIHHPEGDLFSHSIQVLQRTTAKTNDPLTRFCAMFHDLGKLATPPALYPKHHGHDLAGFAMAQDFCRRLRLPAQYGIALAWCSRLHGTFNLWDQLRDGTKLKIADQAIKAGIVDILPLVSAADKDGGSEPREWRNTVEIAGLSAQSLCINQDQLIQIKPNKRGDFILQAKILRLREVRKD